MQKQRMHQTISDKHRLFSACGSDQMTAPVGSFFVGLTIVRVYEINSVQKLASNGTI